jgi:putative hemolysin
MVPVDQFTAHLGLPGVPADEEGEYNTLGGFVLARTGRIPAVAECFEWNGWQFEVVDMDGNRVDKVLATPLGEPADESPDGTPGE